MSTVELATALKLVNSIVFTKTGRVLRDPELALFQGTWLGLTYEQMAESSQYSNNYLMRDVGPKLWRVLSDALEEPVGKTNLRSVLERRGSDEPSAAVTFQPGQDYGNRPQPAPAPIAPALKSKPQPAPHRLTPDLNPLRHPDSAQLTLSYGRVTELATLKQWMVQENCQLVGIWGLSGVGKTILVRTLIDQIQSQFEVIVWRSLKPAPTLPSLIDSLPERLAGDLMHSQPAADRPPLAKLPTRPSLLILTGIEAILQPEQTAGHYQAGYEPYRDLFQRMCEGDYPCRILVIGMEPPREFTRLEGETASVRSLGLSGLTTKAAELILEDEKLVRSDQWATLIDYYQGHPAALRMAARIIRNLFSGSVGEFLKQRSFIFEDINQRLGTSFNRLSGLEKEVLYWLASEDQPTPLSTLQHRSPLSGSPVELLEALDSLKQRSLLEIIPTDDQALFTLQPMVRDYVVTQFIAQVRSAPTPQNWPYRWSSQSTRYTLELSPSVPKIINLSGWLHNRFEPDWQPVERLFTTSTHSPQRLRGAFHLRGDDIIKRFKDIPLGATQSHKGVVLLVAINQEADQTVNICVQVQPHQSETTLPAQLKLSLLDAAENTLAEIESQQQDDFIQLPYFRGPAQETFNIQLSLNAASHREKFMI